MQYGWEVLQHSPCSLDLVPQASVFWAFQKVFLISLLQAIGVDIYAKGLPLLVSHWCKCISVEMEFVLKISVCVCTMLITSALLHVVSQVQFDLQLLEHPCLITKIQPLGQMI